MIAVGTLDTLVAQAVMVTEQDVISSTSPVISSEVEKSQYYKYIIPMIDARRMEVYSAVL
jgi:hypothetical protein